MLASPVQDVVGARGIAFNKRPKRSYTILGYPVQPNPPYDGERLITCRSSFAGFDPTGRPATQRLRKARRKLRTARKRVKKASASRTKRRARRKLRRARRMATRARKAKAREC